MIRIPVSVLIVAAASSCLCNPAEEPTIPPLQATPVVNLLKAIEDEDLELFKTCYSTRMRDEFSRRGWREVFFQFVRPRKEGLRSTTPPEIRYSFFGLYGTGATGFVSGNVLVLVLGEYPAAFELDVINEGGEWRIDDDRLARDVRIRGVLRVAREK